MGLGCLFALALSTASILPASLLYAAASTYDNNVFIDLDITDKGQNSVRTLRTALEYDMLVTAFNQGDRNLRYLTIFEVRDSDGITIWLDIKKGGILVPAQSTDASAVFHTDMPGNYTLRAFVMEDSKSPVWASPIASTSFAVETTNFAGVYIPLYKRPDLAQPDGVWNSIIEAKSKYPSVPFVVTVNPSSGPGRNQDDDFVYAVSELKHAGVDYMLGYVPTDYAHPQGRSLSELKRMIESYRVWYPELDGIMLDEVLARSDKFEFYEELASYARSLGFEFIRANAGAPFDEEYLGIFDNIAVFEGRILPDISQLQVSTYYPEYAPERFSLTARNIASLDANYLDEALGYVGLIYVTDDLDDTEDRNPYDRLPPYFQDLIELLNMHHLGHRVV